MKLISLISKVRHFNPINSAAMKLGAYVSLKTFGKVAKKYPFVHNLVDAKLENLKSKVTDVQKKLQEEVQAP